MQGDRAWAAILESSTYIVLITRQTQVARSRATCSLEKGSVVDCIRDVCGTRTQLDPLANPRAG